MVPTRLELWRQPATLTIIMRLSYVNLKHTVTAFGVVFSLTASAFAEDVPVDLLDRLRNAQGIEAKRLAREAETIWSRSGSPAMDFLLKRGMDAMQAGDYDQAVEHLTALVDHAPDFAQGYHLRAQAYYGVDLLGPALQDIEVALALNPQNFETIYGLGVLARALGSERRAVELFEQVLQMHPEHEGASKALEYMAPSVRGRKL